jgi:tetratricopeptide (TPR) repeat protein
MEHLELALAIKPSYREAAALMAVLALNAKDAAKAVTLATSMIARSRKDAPAWYLLGVAQAMAGKTPEAVNAFVAALQLEPDFETARIALESLAMAKLPLTDAKRKALSDYHTARGDSLRAKHFLDAAYLEYRRALMLEPEAVAPRVAFASIYRANGLPRKYLKELQIIDSLGKADADLQAEIEVRARELQSGVAADWKVDQYALEHQKRSVLVVGHPGVAVGEPHVVREDEQLVTYLRQGLQRYDSVDVVEAEPLLMSFEQAFRYAREKEIDYFVVADFAQTDRSFSVSTTIYLGRTGTTGPATIAFATPWRFPPRQWRRRCPSTVFC